jgi:biopolymer transport protein ExbD
MMKFKRSAKLDPIIIAPFINVIFLLLIFFLMFTLMSSQAGINVKLPKAITSDILQEDNDIISITSEDIIYIDNNVVTVPELEKMLSQPAMKNHYILVKADRRASMGRIVDIWNLCRKLNIERVNIATSMENK